MQKSIEKDQSDLYISGNRGAQVTTIKYELKLDNALELYETIKFVAKSHLSINLACYNSMSIMTLLSGLKFNKKRTV